MPGGQPQEQAPVAVPPAALAALMDGSTNRFKETMTPFKNVEFRSLLESILFTEQPTGKGANAAEDYNQYCKERKKALSSAHNALKEKMRRIEGSKQKEAFKNDLE
eukprot:363094-Amphidinium_carterae.1